MALLDINHYVCLERDTLPSYFLHLSTSLYVVPKDLGSPHSPSSAVALPRHVPDGACDDYKYDSIRMRTGLGIKVYNPRMGPLVDRCCYLCINVFLPSFRDHARPPNRTQKYDGRLASSCCRAHRRCCFRWDRFERLAKFNSCALDAHDILRPLGYSCTSRNGNPSHVLPPAYSA